MSSCHLHRSRCQYQQVLECSYVWWLLCHLCLPALASCLLIPIVKPYWQLCLYSMFSWYGSWICFCLSLWKDWSNTMEEQCASNSFPLSWNSAWYFLWPWVGLVIISLSSSYNIVGLVTYFQFNTLTCIWILLLSLSESLEITFPWDLLIKWRTMISNYTGGVWTSRNIWLED